MNREAQDNLLLLIGAMMLQIGFTDLHLRYVKPSMQPLILITGAGLFAIGLLGVARLFKKSAPDTAATGTAPAEHGGHTHAGPRAAWLLVLPLLVMATVTPPTLGAFAAARSSTNIEVPEYEPPPLPEPRDGAVDLTLTDYYSRVLYDPDELRDVPVRLSGFVTPVDGEWYVTRMQLSCCAADGRPIKVLAVGATAPAADTWVEVVGTYTTPRAPDGELERAVALEIESVREAPRPQNPYEQ